LEKQAKLDGGRGKDRMTNPELERWYATRAKSHKVEVPGASHAVYVSRPKESLKIP